MLLIFVKIYAYLSYQYHAKYVDENFPHEDGLSTRSPKAVIRIRIPVPARSAFNSVLFIARFSARYDVLARYNFFTR